MRIASIFIDMFLSENACLQKPEIENQDLISFFDRVGGNFFPNSFTSGPDTSRSMSQFWSGNFPYTSGIISTGNSPYYYLKNETMLDFFSEAGYKNHIYSSFYKRFSLPMNFKEFNYNINEDMLVWLDETSKVMDDNCFLYIDLHDYHWAIDDYGVHSNAIRKGVAEVLKSLVIIDRKIDLLSFDVVHIFSDHGHLSRGDYNNKKYLFNNLLGNQRIKILNYWKFPKNTSYNVHKLISISDFLPTYLDLIKFNYTKLHFDGISILKNNSHEYLYSENSYNLYPHRNNTIDIWRVVSKAGSLTIDYKNTIKIEGNVDKRKMLDYLKTKSEAYKLHDFKLTIKEAIDKNKKNYNKSYFSNGSPRSKIHFLNFLIRKALTNNNILTKSIRSILRKIRALF